MKTIKKDDYFKMSVKNLTQDILSFLYVTDEGCRRLNPINKVHAGMKPSFANILNIDSFDVIEPATKSYFKLFDRIGEDDLCLLPEDVYPKDVVNIDQTVLTNVPDDFTYSGLPVSYHLGRLKQISIKSIRGIANPVSPYIYNFKEAFVHPDASMSTTNNTYSWVNGKFMVLNRIHTKGMSDGRVKSKWVYDEENEANLLFPWTMAYTNLTKWRVAIGYRPSSRIALSISPETIKMLFNDRDKPANKDRRSPLQHIVRDHLRKLPYKTEEYISVVKHLRGSMSFKWQDFHCEILPPKWLLSNMEYTKLFKK